MIGVVLGGVGMLGVQPAMAGKGRLDGRVYEAATLGEELTFENGRFYTTKSASAGYRPGAYQAAPWAGGIGFRAKLRNSAGRTMVWQGLIKGDLLDGEILMNAERGQRTKTPFIAKLKTKKS